MASRFGVPFSYKCPTTGRIGKWFLELKKVGEEYMFVVDDGREKKVFKKSVGKKVRTDDLSFEWFDDEVRASVRIKLPLVQVSIVGPEF